jgi:hypothetical protein
MYVLVRKTKLNQVDYFLNKTICFSDIQLLIYMYVLVRKIKLNQVDYFLNQTICFSDI